MNAPTTIPSPEEFLALCTTEEDEAESVEAGQVEPLESIAASLRSIAASLAPKEQCEHAEDLADTLRVFVELEALHDAKQAQIEKVLEICKPSVGKLANRIREVLEPMPEPAAEPESDGKALTETQLPADDADVEVWRAYAHSLGYTGHGDIDKMNRSQIRTMLGVRQPVAQAVAEG